MKNRLQKERVNKIKKTDREFIKELCDEINPYRICEIFDSKSKMYKEAKLIYFNLGKNPYFKSFKNKIMNGYSIIGVSDYEKSYIFDNKYDSKSERIICASKTINLDLNVLTYLEKIVDNKKLEDQDRFIEYLKYIKKSGYNLNMSTSLLERISKPIYKKIWYKYILSFIKYEVLDEITERNLIEDYLLTEDEYRRAKEILDVSVYREEQEEQFYVVACLISKAFLLKQDKIDKKIKLKKLLEYSLNRLNIYLEFELYLMFMYLMNDETVQETFSKIQNISKKSLEKIGNISWDILHIRLIEMQMISDLKGGQIVFHYIGTKDIGLQNIININPLKLIGFLDGQSIMVREKNIKDIFFDEQMGVIFDKHINKANIGTMNYKEIFTEISSEVEKLVNANMK
ncbi:MAG: hypothetical protein Q4P30_03850 [Eubacteriales bacterium]|nr:hypothetical protein [Eubacteriales bacterium]